MHGEIAWADFDPSIRQRAARGRLSHEPLKARSLEGWDVVPQQDAVEVVDLVLKDSCEQTSRLEADEVSSTGCPAHRHMGGAWHIRCDARQTEAALQIELPLERCPLEFRVPEVSFP